ncbi:kinase-like domain-containing protein [Xylogone sp. PMI_703]|nr:kinase-like domain-containing protein [Xylogone sp. PMI_703]
MASPSKQQNSQNSDASPRASVTPLRQHTFRGCSRLSDYDLLGKLGEGTFGEVHRAKSKKTGAIVALKKILMHNEKDGFPITALREIKLLKLLSHPNVLKLEEMAVEHHQKGADKRKRAIMYMVTPYMDHDLSGLLENPNVKFTEPQIKCYMLQLLEGLRYLHDNQILHRDMKAANLLINNKGILQIADFGLARHYDEPVPQPGKGGGEARREYTTLVVTRWYRPPELLLHLRRYTTAIDLWGVGCVFGEMLIGKPILAGDSDANQLHIIFGLVGSPTDDSMPGWRQLPGAQGLNIPYQPSTLSQRFREYGSGAISLLSELLKLDWRKRINAIDALKHPYFRNDPLPAEAGDLPTFEDSHELDRRKFRSQKAAPPPAPKGGTVGMGPNGSWGGEGTGSSNPAFGNSDSYGGYRNQTGNRHTNSYGGYRNGVPLEDRRPAWRRDDRPDTRLPPRPPAADFSSGWRDRGRPDHTDGYRPLSRDHEGSAPRNRAPPGARSDIDTYIPSYGADSGRRADRSREDRPRDDWSDRRRRDDRRDRALEYEDHGSGPRSRSRSPMRDRGRDRGRDREPLDRDRDRDLYRR